MSEDARRLLRALVDVEMVRLQTQDEEDVAGRSVSVSLEATEAAGIEGGHYYNERVNAALAQLQAAEALEYDHETSEMSRMMGVFGAYRITRRGISQLREMEV